MGSLFEYLTRRSTQTLGRFGAQSKTFSVHPAPYDTDGAATYSEEEEEEEEERGK